MAYKNVKAYKKGYFKVGDGHQIYYELCGNPEGKPVMFVHGGPGGGFSDKDKRFFNLKKFNVILFDQRGSGRSKPFASLNGNTTFKLAEDMRKLLGYLKIDKIILFGGSWGSTLSLVYAIRYPETVIGMVLRGIFLGSNEENDYFVYGVKDHFPEAWERMASLVPEKNRKNIIEYYYNQMNSKNEKIRKKFTLEWARYEFSVSKLIYSEKKVKETLKEVRYEAFSLIELHYLKNNCFLPKNYILNNAGKIKCPVSIVHGRYDLVCSPESAYRLDEKLKNSKLFFTLAGHSASDEENEKMLIKEINKI